MTFAQAARCYWLEVFPVVRRELRGWRERAAAIPDPALRHDALIAHRHKRNRAEGLAAFAVLAPRSQRRRVIRATVAFNTIMDYVDVVSERPCADPVANTVALHRALEGAVAESTPPEDYYASSPHRDDGGYLAAQVEVCRANLALLPSYPAVVGPLRRCTRLDAEAQGINHALLFGADEREAVSWADETARKIRLDGKLEWWEMVVGAASPVPVGALIAAASDPAISPKDACDVEAAYLPWVAALSGLLESLIDLDTDPLASRHAGRYRSESAAAERMAAIAARAHRLVSDLPGGQLHEMLLAAMAGYCLAYPGAWQPGREQIASGVLGVLGKFARPGLAVHCARQGRPRLVLCAQQARWRSGVGEERQPSAGTSPEEASIASTAARKAAAPSTNSEARSPERGAAS